MVQSSAGSKVTGGYDGAVILDVDRDGMAESVADVNSIVSELDSDTGTQYAETLITQDNNPIGSSDVGNMQDANEYLSLKNEDEQRRWFYSQCLTVKLACPDKARARKTLISDLYAKVREEGVAIENWVAWIRSQLMPEEAAAGGMAGLRSSPQEDMSRTMPGQQPFASTFGSDMMASTQPVGRTLGSAGLPSQFGMRR